jgi:hypothetical protein
LVALREVGGVVGVGVVFGDGVLFGGGGFACGDAVGGYQVGDGGQVGDSMHVRSPLIPSPSPRGRRGQEFGGVGRTTAGMNPAARRG